MAILSAAKRVPEGRDGTAFPQSSRRGRIDRMDKEPVILSALAGAAESLIAALPAAILGVVFIIPTDFVPLLLGVILGAAVIFGLVRLANRNAGG